ncbi:Rof transcriptional antiterminator [Thiogranum longum]|uniref:Rof transcriptional antiterminator n=1 Tax=Thiogranum longum TaxID=1537524 RepID=A0A4R1H945_9GAMM|nr:transcriptional antiterminator, Rof [Thiogranum longum]TCK17031.1 Rof transcriptional antiterminator [Thiogranum longum]
MTDYTPIDCGLHSEYELAIMHGDMLRLEWHDESCQPHIEPVKPLDLQAHNSEEFLLVETREGEKLQIRLDRIVHKETI